MNGTMMRQEQTPQSHSRGRYVVVSALFGLWAGIFTVQTHLPFYVVAPVAGILAGWIAGSSDKWSQLFTPPADR